jgi:hypothetical protein
MLRPVRRIRVECVCCAGRWPVARACSPHGALTGGSPVAAGLSYISMMHFSSNVFVSGRARAQGTAEAPSKRHTGAAVQYVAALLAYMFVLASALVVTARMDPTHSLMCAAPLLVGACCARSS